uniref:Uncharacterized protein n=1 Tax=Streptomyces auratus AGR0001 TaxID=1160718 RepID=J2A0S4_9ACTN
MIRAAAAWARREAKPRPRIWARPMAMTIQPPREISSSRCPLNSRLAAVLAAPSGTSVVASPR